MKAEIMKINGNEIRPGNVVRHKDSIWMAVKSQAVKPGKGPAYNQVELKNVFNGSKLNERFRASETVERLRLDQKEHTFLYKDGTSLIFMDAENYEQISIETDFIGERSALLQEGMQVTVESHDGKTIGVRLPEHVVLEVRDTEPTVKGQTASSSYKPSTTENGLRVMVPPHIDAGQKIVLNTQTMEYVRRAD